MAHDKLILEAFEKSFIILKSKGASDSKKAAAEILSNYLDEHFLFSFSERRLRDYYNAALENEEVLITQQTVRDGLASFLGFDNYQEWRSKRFSENPKQLFTLVFIISFLKRNKTTLSIIFIGLGVLFGVNLFTKDRWMVWRNDQYVETSLDKKNFEKKQFVIYDKNLKESFKKIIPTCETEFFTANGTPQIWYGKNIHKELEYFTASGNHPETGKALKPITKYMINKYICNL